MLSKSLFIGKRKNAQSRHSARTSIVCGRLARVQALAENGTVRSPAKPLLLAVALCLPLAGQAAPNTVFQQANTKPHAPPPPEARIDINRASVDELAKVPGLTPTWAARIVRFRPYRTKEDLLERGVLPSDVYDRIKDYVIAHRVNP
jgi:competence protein ComEA